MGAGPPGGAAPTAWGGGAWRWGEEPEGPGEGPSHALTASLPPRDRQDPDEPAAPAGARVPPPVPRADPVARALRSVLTGLQHQMGRQRDEYEARISRYGAAT